MQPGTVRPGQNPFRRALLASTTCTTSKTQTPAAHAQHAGGWPVPMAITTTKHPGQDSPPATISAQRHPARDADQRRTPKILRPAPEA
jgi:hypothetical protein